jgi:transcriptional regulator with XRE-family HTH domain
MATLKELREEALLSKVELARLCQVSYQTVWEWENAKARPSPAHQRQLVDIFHRSPRELLDAIKATQEAAKERPAAVAGHYAAG